MGLLYYYEYYHHTRSYSTVEMSRMMHSKLCSIKKTRTFSRNLEEYNLKLIAVKVIYSTITSTESSVEML